MDYFLSLYEKNEKFYKQIIKVMIILLIVYIFINYIFRLVVPFLIGYLIYLCLRPVVNYIDNKFKVNRGLIAIFSIMIFITIVVGLVFSLGIAIYDQAELFLTSKNYSEKIVEFFDETVFSIKNTFVLFSNNIGEDILSMIIDAVYGITNSLITVAKDISLSIVSGLPNFIAILIISIISSFFFLKDEALIIASYNRFFPESISKHISKVKNSTGLVALGYIKAQFILSSVTFIIGFIGLNILQNQYAILLSVALAFFDMLPFFGAGFILWPTAFIYYLIGNTSFAITTMVLYAIIFVVRQILEPRTLGKQISLHPVFTLAGLFIGVKVFGMEGIIVGPLTVVLIRAFLIDDGSDSEEVEEVEEVETEYNKES